MAPREMARAEHQRANQAEQDLKAAGRVLDEANRRISSLGQQVAEERRIADYEWQRDDWAAAQYEAQGEILPGVAGEVPSS